MVEPVVVIPDTDSNKASVKLSPNSENHNGIDPKMQIINHDVAVIKKACLTLICEGCVV